ncbi:MAG TPA: hypothetical protein VIC84_23685 [Blastocatellia bacterium]|jgi:hypothetical protein
MNAPNHSYLHGSESQAPASPQEQQRQRLIEARNALTVAIQTIEATGQPATAEHIDALKHAVFPLLNSDQPPAGPQPPKTISRSDQEAMNANIEAIAAGRVVVK